MKKVEDLVKEIQIFDFLLEFKREQNPLIKIKLQALHHLQSGRGIKETADIVLYDVQAVRSWIRRFVKYDYEGLIEPQIEEFIELLLDTLYICTNSNLYIYTQHIQ